MQELSKYNNHALNFSHCLILCRLACRNYTGIILGILIEYGIVEIIENNMSSYIMVEKVKDVVNEEESEDVYHSGSRIYNGIKVAINESQMNTLIGSTNLG